MILFGCALGSEEQFQTILVPGVKKSAANELVGFLPVGDPGYNTSIFPLYADILRQARSYATRFDVEALVLLHTDLELDDIGFAEKVRKTFKANPDCAIIGAIGGKGVDGCEWWKGREKIGHARDAVTGVINFGRYGECDTVDGMLLILSPWAIEHLEADCTTYHGFHAYDADFCAQARAAGKTVIAECFNFIHRCKKEPTGGQDALNAADKAFRAKWKKQVYKPGALSGHMARYAGKEKDDARPPRFTGGPRKGGANQ